MRWILYNFFFAIGYLVMLPGFLMRMARRGGYRRNFHHRLGRYGQLTLARLTGEQPDNRPIWIHAVSVGEVYVAAQMMHALRAKRPGIRFVLSTTSSTGWREAEKRVHPEDVLIYYPLDFPLCVRRALDAIRPKAFILTESEIWPNLIRMCSRRHIPVMLFNGRISDRSAPRYRYLKYWFGPVLREFSVLLMQSEMDRQRILAAGADPARAWVTGSVKFDVAHRNPAKEAQAAQVLQSLDMGPGRKILMGGSTWHGEEPLLISIYQRLQARIPELRLLLAPRHFERAAAVAAHISSAGLVCVRKSRLDAGEKPLATGENAVLLLDTTGEMLGFYAHAAVVFVGKTLTARGGQNMIEPCLLGKPTVVGPNTQNFRPIMADLLASRAIIQVPDADALESAIAQLLDFPDLRAEIGSCAAAAVEKRQGVIGRCADIILKSMDT